MSLGKNKGFIKVCGVTSVEGAEMLVDAGVDAVGLNLWHKSPRGIDIARAAEIAAAVRGRVQVISVTVDMDIDSLRQVQAHLRPDRMQLHGHEPDEVLAALGKCAFRAVGLRTDADVQRAIAAPGSFVLVDARDDIMPGGTGKAPPESLVSAVCAARPAVLAGGLSADNVAESIERFRPVGVDVASGVERAPGDKDPVLVRAFVSRARAAFAAIAESH